MKNNNEAQGVKRKALKGRTNKDKHLVSRMKCCRASSPSGPFIRKIGTVSRKDKEEINNSYLEQVENNKKQCPLK